MYKRAGIMQADQCQGRTDGTPLQEDTVRVGRPFGRDTVHYLRVADISFDLHSSRGWFDEESRSSSSVREGKVLERLEREPLVG